MKLEMPVGSSVADIERMLRSNGIEISWIMPATGPVKSAEWIEIPSDSDLPYGTMVDRNTGEFLALERFHSHSYRSGWCTTILCYRVLRRITPEEFYSRLGRKVQGHCFVGEIAGHLELAFHQNMARELGMESALFAYRAPDGGLVFQHSM